MATQKFLTAGEWRDSSETLEVRSPYNGRLAGTTYRPTEADVEDAVAAAVPAAKETGSLPTYRRSEILQSIRSGISRRREDFARTITLEAGKPITVSRKEVERAIHVMGLAAEEVRRTGGELLPLDLLESAKGYVAVTKRFPVGPILGITPFNFPLNLVCHKVAPAIAAGNPVIIKPASATPLTALLLAEVIDESGLPQGAFSVLPCTADMAGRMVTDERLKMLTFTGSSEAGWRLKAGAGKKKVLLELGGNAGAIVDRDADIELAARRAVYGAFAFSGQTCISLQRLYVHEGVYTPFLDLLLEHTKGLKTGDPMEETTSVGPLITADAARRVDGWLRESVSRGARIITGGRLLDNNIIEPTVVTDTRPDMKIACEEVFGPVVTVTAFSSFDQAVDGLNRSRFGLQAGVFTSDINKIFMAYNALEVGGVIINDIPTFRADNMPYGGVKDSGMGREGVRYAIEEMTEPRVLVLNLG